MNKGKRVLLIWPKTDEGYYDFNPLIEIFGLRGQFFPLSLLYVAAALGNQWHYTLLDNGIDEISEKVILQNDFILISANILQRQSAEKIIKEVKRFKKPIIIGGPLLSTLSHVFNDEGITKVIGEIESVEASHSSSGATVADILSRDMESGRLLPQYLAKGHPDLTQLKLPRYDLINPRRYFNLSVQTSRGCHHFCDFCQEVPLYGKHHRKTPAQVIEEFDALHKIGEGKTIYIIDDNFMGNISLTEKKQEFIELLSAIETWQKKHDYPFDFLSQCSLEVADHEDIIDLMTRIGLNILFVGIESVDESSLASVHKTQNLHTDMVEKIRKLQQAGMGVFAGMIIGFDNETDQTVECQIDFIRNSHIPLVGMSLLLGFPGTRLFKKMQSENRISHDPDALTKSFRSNIILKMEPRNLYANYVKFSKTIYNPDEYFQRCITWTKEWNDSFVLPGKKGSLPANLYLIRLTRSIVYQGIIAEYRWSYWKYLLKSLIYFGRHYNKLALALYLGYFFKTMYSITNKLDHFYHNLPSEIISEWENRFPQSI